MEKIDNDSISFYIEDEILYSEFKFSMDLTVEVGKQMIELRHQISNGKNQYWCYDFRGIKSMPKEARDYAEEFGQSYLMATGAVVNSHITKFIINTFSRLKNAKIPFKAFTSKEDAVSWLKQLKAENEAKGIY